MPTRPNVSATRSRSVINPGQCEHKLEFFIGLLLLRPPRSPKTTEFHHLLLDDTFAIVHYILYLRCSAYFSTHQEGVDGVRQGWSCG